MMLTLLLLAVATLDSLLSEDDVGHTVLISGYNRKVGVFNITGNGHIVTPISQLEVDGALSWLEVDGDLVYAIDEDSNLVSRWRLSGDYSRLEKLEQVEMPGSGPAHLAVDRELGLVFSANYGSGTWTVLSLETGGGLGQVIQHEDFSGLCSSSHPHQTVLLGDRVWVVDLGCETLHLYHHTAGRLERRGEVRTPAGCGPRHLTLLQGGERAALLCEQDSKLLLYRVHQDGNLTLTQTLLLSSVPSDYGAEVLVNRAGDRLYATSRGSGVIVVYRVTSQGLQREENVFNLSGSWPRHFALKEDMMVVTDQHGDSAQIVHIDRDGLLLPGKTFPVEKQPAFVTFL